MNTEMIQKNWTELKGKIKSKWGKFSDEEVESVKGDLSLLAGKIEAVYGIAKEHAEGQYDEFKKSVQSLIAKETTEAPRAGPNVMATSLLPKPKPVIVPQSIKIS